jgi:hypothetical protein
MLSREELDLLDKEDLITRYLILRATIDALEVKIDKIYQLVK